MEISLGYFELSEFDCKETGENKMDSRFLKKLDALRWICGFPFVINSGYRSPEHSVEKAKAKAGTHSKGIASDIACTNSVDRIRLVKLALKAGFTGIGIHKDFIHLDIRDTTPVMWVY